MTCRRVRRPVRCSGCGARAFPCSTDGYVTVTVETPRNLTKEQKEALKKFSELLGESNYEKRKSIFNKKK